MRPVLSEKEAVDRGVALPRLQYQSHSSRQSTMSPSKSLLFNWKCLHETLAVYFLQVPNRYVPQVPFCRENRILTKIVKIELYTLDPRYCKDAGYW